LEEFLKRYEDEVLDSQILLSLDIALRDTSARWWGAHKQTIKYWYQCKRLLCIKFGAEQKRSVAQKYNGQETPTKHLEKCIALWRMIPPKEWPHNFLHTPKGIPANWYTNQELRRGTTSWETLQ
jgi:hypothetical protein